MKITRALFPLILGLTWTSLLACSESAEPPTSSDPGPADAGSTDVVSLDASIVTDEDVSPPCESGELVLPAVNPEQTKFALSLFHFNVEYVVGGLEYVDKNGTVHSMSEVLSDPELVKGWDNDRVEDWIITETFEPILDIYLDHPDWRVNIELQAYMIEVLAERHPEILAKLHTLAWLGQVELISFHYSAQLFLAYPKEDLVRSIARTKQVFEEHCLPLSGVVFNQEGQAGLGWMRTLVEEGYTIGVYPKNLYRYVHDGVPMWPYYASEGGTMIVGPGSYEAEAGVEIVWDFFDDGELRAVPDLINPYLAPLADKDPARIAEFTQQLQDRHDDGYIVTTISDMVAHLEALGVDKPPAPSLVDGTWQAKSTDSIHRWLGGRSDVFAGAEEDNRVRSGNAEARMHVSATQVLVEHAASLGMEVSGFEEEMVALWDRMFHAEISDASGVNPWRGEVLFALEANEEILALATAIQHELMALMDAKHVLVDLLARSVNVLEEGTAPAPWIEAEAPAAMEIRADGRQVDAQWFELDENRWRLMIEVSAATECEDCDLKWVEVRFPRTHDALEYSPGLIEDEVVLQPLSGFSLQLGEVYLPLANGLIGLGEGRYAIKHVRDVHVAARVALESTTVDFIDETLPADQGASWTFEFFEGGAEDALAIANRINTFPTVILNRN